MLWTNYMGGGKTLSFNANDNTTRCHREKDISNLKIKVEKRRKEMLYRLEEDE